MRVFTSLCGWGAATCWMIVLLEAVTGQCNHATLEEFAVLGVVEFIAIVLTAMWVIGRLVLAVTKPPGRWQ